MNVKVIFFKLFFKFNLIAASIKIELRMYLRSGASLGTSAMLNH